MRPHRPDPAAAQLQPWFDELYAKGALGSLLDVGCGRIPPLPLQASVRLVGIDIDARALAENESLDERIIGNIEDHPLPPESMDAVLCWNILEHLRDPQRALENIARTLRAGGILAISVPNPYSLKGILTKLTPYSFHRWAYRRLLGSQLTPYRTYMRRVIGPKALPRVCDRYGLALEYRQLYAPALEKRLPMLLGITWKFTLRVLNALSFGRYEPGRSEAIFLFRKTSLPVMPRQGRASRGASPRLPTTAVTTPIRKAAAPRSRGRDEEHWRFPSSTSDGGGFWRSCSSRR